MQLITSKNSVARDALISVGIISLAGIVAYLALSLRLYASYPVLLVLLIGELVLCVAFRISKLSLTVVVSLTLIIGLTVIETDNYVQFGTLKPWGAPVSITMCGLTRHLVGVQSRVDGNGDLLRRITTTPAGLAVLGEPGCPEDPLYVQDGSRFLVYE